MNDKKQFKKEIKYLYYGIVVYFCILIMIFIKFGVNEISVHVDICKCLTEAGDSEYIQENGDACRDAISKELGVDNWEKVNFSKDAKLSAKFDVLVEKCN